jgi:hypothetical protein
VRRGRRLRSTGPLKRGTPIKRRAPIKPRRSRPRRRPYAPDPAYLAWVRTLRCSAPHGPHGCRGAVQPHHAGARGLGQKADDHSAVALCDFHHRSWHDGRGVFLGWDRHTRAAWAAEVIGQTQQLWLDRTPPRGSA